MKKIMLLTALFAVLTYSIFAQQQPAALPRLAVFEFNTNIDNQELKADAAAVRNMAESELSATGKFRIMTRTEIDKLLSNQKFQASSISSSENIEILKMEQISYIVTGTVDIMRGDYAITLNVFSVSNGQISHSDNIRIRASEDFYDGVIKLIKSFASGMSTSESGAIVQGQARRTPAATGIAIEVSTKDGGTLYFQNEEIATLWDNDTHSIPIEKPGTYTVKMVFGNGNESISTVTITQRGITKIEFKYYIGAIGPGGGYVFYDKGNNNDGWQYLEAAPANTEFTAQWGHYGTDISGTRTVVGTGRQNTRLIGSGNAAQLCTQLTINGLTGWFLPSKDELDLMYKNLKAKGLGGFKDVWYWSSSQYSNNYAWGQNFLSGGQKVNLKDSTNSVRAIRAF